MEEWQDFCRPEEFEEVKLIIIVGLNKEDLLELIGGCHKIKRQAFIEGFDSFTEEIKWSETLFFLLSSVLGSSIPQIIIIEREKEKLRWRINWCN